MKKLGVFVLTLFLLGCGKLWKEVEDYYAYYGIDIDESVEILDNNEDVLIEGKILNITPDGIKIMGGCGVMENRELYYSTRRSWRNEGLVEMGI